MAHRDRGSSGSGGDRLGRHFGSVVDRAGRMGPGVGVRVDGGARRRLVEDRGPHWGKGPKGYKRSDERTREDVCDAIAFQGHIDATEVEVKVENGVVTLRGTVALREHKRALERLVERCRGAREVHNELHLAGAPAMPSTTSTTGASTGNQKSRNARA